MFACRRKREQCADDFAHYAWIQRKARPHTFKLGSVWIDFVRESQPFAGLSRKKIRLTQMDLDVDDQGRAHEFPDDCLLLAHIERWDRALLTMHVKYDLSKADIADILGVSPGRVSQYFDELRARVTQAIL